jgi:hypothetical protein
LEVDSVYTSYKQYKTNTDAVATWLLATAQKYGCRDYDSSDKPLAASTAPRLKGKARKVAREADAAAGKQSRPSARTYRIEIKDFIKLAQYIAKSTKPQIKVPGSVVRDLQQAIHMRRRHQAWLVGAPTETNSTTSDHRHTHFTQTLETVMEVFRPNMPETFRTKPAQNDVDHKACPLANMFEHLTVEEPAEAGDLGANVRKEAAAENINVTVSDAAEDKDEEAFIASVYLTRDAHILLEDMRDVWVSYQQGHVELMAAAIATNTAIEFCRKLQEEFEATFPGQEGMHERSCFCCIGLRAANSEKHDCKYPNDTCLTSSRAVLLAFAMVLKDEESGREQMAPLERMSLYCGGSIRRPMDEDQCLGQDVCLATGMLPEFFALIAATPRVRAEHEVFRGLRRLKLE